jgi:hypothetical protein
MIYEYREYNVAPGRMDELQERFKKHTLRLFKRHGIKPVLFCAPYSEGTGSEFHYIVMFDDLVHMQVAWDKFMRDPERQRIWEESNAKGQLVLNIRSVTLTAIVFEEN